MTVIRDHMQGFFNCLPSIKRVVPYMGDNHLTQMGAELRP